MLNFIDNYTYHIFPFNILNYSDVHYPSILYDCSRVTISVDPISNDLLDMIFPNQGYSIMNGVVLTPISRDIHRLDRPYSDLRLSNAILRIARKPNSYKEPDKFNRYVNFILDLFLLVLDLPLKDYLIVKNSKCQGSGSKGGYRPDSVFVGDTKVTTHEIEAIRTLYLFLLQHYNQKIETSLDLFRQSSIDSNISYGLKCSLRIILIESLISKGKISKEQFGEILSDKLQDDNYKLYKSLYSERGVFLHGGIDQFDIKSHKILTAICKKLIIDAIEGKN